MKKRSFLSRLAVMLCIPLLFVPHVEAASVPSSSAPAACIDNNYITITVNHYCETSASACSATTGSTGSLNGGNNTEKAFNFLLAKGLTAEQTAGVIGNLEVESGMVPDNQENSKTFPAGGWGLAQWTGSRRTDIKKALEDAKKGDLYTNEQTPSDRMDELLLFELNFLWDEATKRGDIEHLKSDTKAPGPGQTPADIIKAAVISWERWYERAGNPALGARYTRGQEAYDKYAKNSAATSNSDQTTFNPADATAAIGTSSTTGCSQATATDGSFVYYSQYDPAWADSSYGSSKIRPSGCGPTSIAMIVSTLTKKRITPKEIASTYSRYYIRGVGSSHALFGAVATDYGLKATNIGQNEAKVKEVLARGGLIIAGGTGPRPFTRSGHIIVVRATINGKYQVGNPLPAPADQGKASEEVFKNTAWFNTEYSWSTISSNSSGMYGIEDPSKQL